MGYNEILLILKHRVRKKLRRANILIAEKANRSAKEVESQKTRTMVIGVSDTKLFAEVPETIVIPTLIHPNIARTYTRLV